MRVIIFNDIKNLDGCLKLVNNKFPKGKKRFWNIDKYIPFLLEKIKNLDKEKFNKEELKLIKTYIYTGKYNAKVISGFKWNCKNKIIEIQEIIDRENSLLGEIKNNNLDSNIKQKIINHVENMINISKSKKEFYENRITKQIRNREGQINFFKKIDSNPFIDLRTTILKQGDGDIYQKGVDVKLATDLINLAHSDSYDIALILGGDTDFVECVKSVQEKFAKIVIVVSCYTKGAPILSNIGDLKTVATHFLNLLEDFTDKEIESMSDLRRLK